MKLFFIIKIEYIASCTPVAPKLCPVKDFVELTGGVEPSPKILLIASISVTAPAGDARVAVAAGVVREVVEHDRLAMRVRHADVTGRRGRREGGGGVSSDVIFIRRLVFPGQGS